MFPPLHMAQAWVRLSDLDLRLYTRIKKVAYIYRLCPVVPDSDEAFLSLKSSSKPKVNGCSKEKVVSDWKEKKPKQVKTPPVKSPSTKGEAAKNVLSPSPPKSTVPKHTPTSVIDYFGSSTAKRSDKKLVASTSTKRKAVSTSAELQCPSFRLWSELVLTVVWSETIDWI